MANCMSDFPFVCKYLNEKHEIKVEASRNARC